MKKISPVKRVAMKLNLILKYYPVEISASSLGTSDIAFNKVASLLHKRLEQLKTNQ